MLKTNLSRVSVKETVDLGRVVAAIKKVEEEGQEVSEEVKAEILKHEKAPETILEEQGHGEILDSSLNEAESRQTSDFAGLGIEVEESYDIEKVVSDVTSYVQTVIDEMDVEASISSSYNRRTINMQIDTNEPGRVIGYHGKVLKALHFWRKITSITATQRIFTLPLMLMTM